jgi:hypothetical protein
MIRYQTMLKASVALLLPVAMAACSDRDSIAPPLGGGGTPTPTPTPTVSVQGQIGAAFAGLFDASNTSEPRDPAATDVPALSLTAEPVAN